MNVISISINLEGKYNLAKLESIGFIKITNNTWKFDGKLHRYIFAPIDNHSVRLIISEKPDSNRGLPHQITFGNFNDWVRKCVDTIEIKG